MAKEATSVYIDDSAIRVLTAKGRRVRKWADMPLEPGLVRDGVIQNEDAVAAKVRELWQARGIRARRVIAGISGVNCLYRWLTLPELPRNLLPEAVRREAGRVLGVPLERLYISWQALPSLKGEISIYLAAAPRNSVDTLVATLRQAGLNPYLMDLRPMALARTTTEPSAIIIDLQPGNFDIVVTVEGIPEVVRSVPLPREALPEETVPLIREELNRAITFYNSSHRDKPIEATAPLLVCGELAEQEDTWKLLTGREKRPARTLLPSIEAPGDFPAGQYVTNIGLVLKEVSGKGDITYSRINFNALPEAYRPKPRPISEILFLPVLIAGIALIAWGAYANINAAAYTSVLRAEWAGISQLAVSKQAQEQAQARAQAEEISALTEQVSLREETADAFTTTLRQFAARRDEVNGDLSQINMLPGAVNLDNVSGSIGTITVNGWGDNEEAIFSYAEDLRASGRFALVVITDMHQGEDKMGFTLTLTK
jgi:type IV pilus assembly protein PilM